MPQLPIVITGREIVGVLKISYLMRRLFSRSSARALGLMIGFDVSRFSLDRFVIGIAMRAIANTTPRRLPLIILDFYTSFLPTTPTVRQSILFQR